MATTRTTSRFAALPNPDDLITSLINHPSYGAEYSFLVSLGRPALFPILTRIETDPAGILFALLEDITGQNPVHPTEYGQPATMAKRWREWANREGMLPRHIRPYLDI